MATPAFDASSSSTVSGASSSTHAHTVSTGVNRVLIVGVESQDASITDGTVTGITYAGVAMTKIDAIQIASDGQYQRSELWYLTAPATGSNNIVVSFTGTVSSGIVGGLSYTNASQSPLTITAKDAQASTTPSVSVTTLVNNSLVVDIISHGNGSNITQSVNTGTERLDIDQSVETGLGMSDIEKVTAGSQARTWTLNGAPTWAQVAVVLPPPSSSSGFLVFM